MYGREMLNHDYFFCFQMFRMDDFVRDLQLRSILTHQEHEREKLRLTLSLQSLRQAHTFEAFSWQHQDPEEVDPLEPRAPRACGCGSTAAHHPHISSAQAEHLEPTESEYRLAVQEAQLALDCHVLGINEKIDEIREVLADL